MSISFSLNYENMTEFLNLEKISLSIYVSVFQRECMSTSNNQVHSTPVERYSCVSQ